MYLYCALHNKYGFKAALQIKVEKNNSSLDDNAKEILPKMFK